jgi:hypothetical protein
MTPSLLRKQDREDDDRTRLAWPEAIFLRNTNAG